ncbi:MAG: PQQ-dependent sugar dehydrogenase [Caldilineaceae bacterium]|nr:PQQ-dependent sugar dehydrogenase [Caldilineaceae bacterium]
MINKLLAVMVALLAAACVPISESDRASSAEVQRQNVARKAIASASSGEQEAHLAVDGDPDTFWNSGRTPLGWLLIDLDETYIVDSIELVVTQVPGGATAHEVWIGDGTGSRALYKRIDSAYTKDGDHLAFDVVPPRQVRQVLVVTTRSPSWVAWREVRIYGASVANKRQLAGSPEMFLTLLVDGLEKPVRISDAGDGSGRLFVVEQEGRIRIIARSADGGVWQAGKFPFLDISGRVKCCGERGLFDIAFPPGYGDKGYFYVSYTNHDGHTVLSRFRLADGPDRADPASEEVILTIEQPHEAHNGGRLAFGPKDGYLYVGSGDGGGVAYNDPDEHGQNASTVLGAILRLDVESRAKPYGIPASNPFSGISGLRQEIWAYGLRNPWGFAFDSETGGLYIPDAGAFRREEVNFQPARSLGGENYGWRTMEGSDCFREQCGPSEESCFEGHWLCSAEGLIGPVAEYRRSEGCVIVGGAVYRGAGANHLQGAFIYADFCTGQIWALFRPGPNSDDGWQSALVAHARTPVSSVAEDQDGNVYVVGYGEGKVWMLGERP